MLIKGVARRWNPGDLDPDSRMNLHGSRRSFEVVEKSMKAEPTSTILPNVNICVYLYSNLQITADEECLIEVFLESLSYFGII